MTSSGSHAALDPTERQERLAGRVGRLRTRGGGGNLDRWLLLTGGVLMPLGFLVVVLGWIGATATGTMLHRPDCAVVAGRPNLRAASPDEPGLSACGLCNPLASDVLTY